MFPSPLRFPRDERFEKWRTAIGNAFNTTINPGLSACICSLHFPPEHYQSGNTKILRSDVTPSIFNGAHAAPSYKFVIVKNGELSHLSQSAINPQMLIGVNEEVKTLSRGCKHN
jgi:hypothetical protein